MAWPDRCSVECSAATASLCWSVLMINRSHRVLTDAPRVILLHHRVRRNDQSGWCSVGQVVIVPVPRTLVRILLRPDVSLVGQAMIQNAFDWSSDSGRPILSGCGTCSERPMAHTIAAISKFFISAPFASFIAFYRMSGLPVQAIVSER